MIVFALLLLAYALFDLFCAEHGLDLAIAIVRLSLACDLMIGLKTASVVVLGSAIFLSAITWVGAMMLIRREVQLKNDH